MKGYKTLDYGLINQYGFKYELNKEYHLNGELDWTKNGFYFCDKPESTLRYAEDKNNCLITEIEAKGKIICCDDTFENLSQGVEGIYASDTMIIKRIISREELIEMVYNSNNIDRAKTLNMYLKLTPEEIEFLLEKFKEPLIPYIEYYQYNDKDAFNVYYKLKKRG